MRDTTHTTAPGADVLVLSPPHQHLEYVLLEAEKALDSGDTAKGVANLAHAVHVARMKPDDPIDGRRLGELIGRIMGNHGNAS